MRGKKKRKNAMQDSTKNAESKREHVFRNITETLSIFITENDHFMTKFLLGKMTFQIK